MACPEGCISGAGQPISPASARKARAMGLYRADKLCLLKRSDENPIIAPIYRNLSPEDVHHIMHVRYKAAVKKID
jgi:NADH-quinone oxidoreductase subunit G